MLTALEYLQQLIDGSQLSSIPVQTSELEFLKALMEQEKKNG